MPVLSCFSSKREPFQPLHEVSACRAAAISGGPLSRQPQQRLSPRKPCFVGGTHSRGRPSGCPGPAVRWTHCPTPCGRNPGTASPIFYGKGTQEMNILAPNCGCWGMGRACGERVWSGHPTRSPDFDAPTWAALHRCQTPSSWTWTLPAGDSQVLT